MCSELCSSKWTREREREREERVEEAFIPPHPEKELLGL
jgi:hypothetical protein